MRDGVSHSCSSVTAPRAEPTGWIKLAGRRRHHSPSPSADACRSPWHRALTGAFAGFLAYGLWGAAVNFEHGLGIAVRVGVGQGAYSFFVTLLLSRLLEALVRWSGGSIWVAFGLGLVALHGGSLTVHLAIATPELALSMAPGLLIGTLYVAAYVRGLARSASGTSSWGVGSMRLERLDLVGLRSSAADVSLGCR